MPAVLESNDLRLEGLITEPQLIEHLQSLGFRVSYPSLWTYRTRPRDPLPYRKLFGRVFYSISEVSDWLALEGRVQASPKVRDAKPRKTVTPRKTKKGGVS